MIAFGGVHAALLFEGDILDINGATGLVLLLLMNRRPSVLVACRAQAASAAQVQSMLA